MAHFSGPNKYIIAEASVNRLHNESFVLIAHERFGAIKFETMIKDFSAGGRTSIAFSPNDRCELYDLIKKNEQKIKVHLTDIDQRFSTLITVLGWSFDASIVASALNTQRNISDIFLAFDSSDKESKDKLIKYWFDADLYANHTRQKLLEILDIKII
jgi:hypothetical protein